MKDNKKAFVLVESVLAAILIILVARMFWERSWEDRYRVSVIIEDSDSSRWSAFRYGLKMAAEDLEVELSIVSTGISLTEEEEKELIESAIGNGAKAVIVQPVPGEGTEEMLTKVAKRVPVMLTGCAASGGGRFPTSRYGS